MRKEFGGKYFCIVDDKSITGVKVFVNIAKNAVFNGVTVGAWMKKPE